MLKLLSLCTSASTNDTAPSESEKIIIHATKYLPFCYAFPINDGNPPTEKQMQCLLQDSQPCLPQKHLTTALSSLTNLSEDMFEDVVKAMALLLYKANICTILQFQGIDSMAFSTFRLHGPKRNISTSSISNSRLSGISMRLYYHTCREIDLKACLLITFQ